MQKIDTQHQLVRSELFKANSKEAELLKREHYFAEFNRNRILKIDLLLLHVKCKLY